MTHTDLAGHNCPPRTAKTSTRMTPATRNVEWKRSWRDDCLAWICGFANARGGVLEIGKDDDGDIVGVRNVLSLLEDIPSKVRSLLGIVIEVNLKSESGLEYIEIVVEPHPNPISYRGKFHYRTGSTKQVLERHPQQGPVPTRHRRRCRPEVGGQARVPPNRRQRFGRGGRRLSSRPSPGRRSRQA